MRCDTCGIAELRNNSMFCVKFQRKASEKESDNCLYYMPVMFEDGERLSALQHLALKEIDLSSKKMKGPV